MIIRHGYKFVPLLAHDSTQGCSGTGKQSKHDGCKATKSEFRTGQQPSKRQQHTAERNARRLEEFQEKKRAALWLSLTQRLLSHSRANLLNSTWTSWMASRSKSSPSTSPLSVAASAPAVLTPAPGMRAQIFGLKSRRELNEIVGVVGEYDTAAGRCALLLPSGEQVAIKPCNLNVETQPIPTQPDADPPEHAQSHTKRKPQGKRSKSKRL